MVLCVGAALAAVAPLLRQGPIGWAALAFLLPFGLEGAAYGNVQPLLVLALLWGAPRRSGPIWVALGASLKLVPIVLVAVYAGRREWARAAWTLAITAALVLPALAFDLSGYPRDIGAGQLSLLTVSPLLFGVVALAAVAAAYRWAGMRWAWLLGSLAMMLALPRFLLYEISFATVGLAEDAPAEPMAAVSTPCGTLSRGSAERLRRGQVGSWADPGGSPSGAGSGLRERWVPLACSRGSCCRRS